MFTAAEMAWCQEQEHSPKKKEMPCNLETTGLLHSNCRCQLSREQGRGPWVPSPVGSWT